MTEDNKSRTIVELAVPLKICTNPISTLMDLHHKVMLHNDKAIEFMHQEKAKDLHRAYGLIQAIIGKALTAATPDLLIKIHSAMLLIAKEELEASHDQN